MFERSEYDGPDHILDPVDYRNAIYVQDACNVSGVICELARVNDRITDEGHARQKGTDWRNQHPLTFLYAAQIAHLSGYASAATSMDRYSWAMKYCRERMQQDGASTPSPQAEADPHDATLLAAVG
jgi:hypothetical protein